MNRPVARILLPILVAPILAGATGLIWGADGHRMAARAAEEALPEAMPGFFLDASDQLVYLNPEPDRWRDRELEAMDQAFAYDHYIDLENVPPEALDAPNRYAFLALLYETDLERPERDAGLLPFRILELYQRLYSGWLRWHRAGSVQERAFVQERILNDAGTLGHYVTDASQPHHTTIHFNGWNASGARTEPNPEGFTEARDFHGRFESGFVAAHVTVDHLRERVGTEARDLGDMTAVRTAIWEYIGETHGHVRDLYRLEKAHGFAPEEPATEEEVEFAADRLAAGAEMLRDLWWTAFTRAAASAGGEAR